MARRKKNARKASAPLGTEGGRLPVYLGIAAVLVLVLVAAGAGVLLATSGGSDDGAADGKRAVIVDQLQLTQPNPEFISNARGILAQAGYHVDYIPGEQVTVDFYRTLPAKGYDLVILRVHAGITTEVDAATGERTGTEYVSLFTGEPYDESKYSEEHLNRLGRATYVEGGDPLFGIGPAFVEKSMDGDFGDAVIFMMGCDGLRSQRTAEAFLGRGASAFVSWTKPISAAHTDNATEILLRTFLLDGMPLERAVEQTAEQVGPDPAYEGELRILAG